jgi:hypothetical protein
MRYRVQPQRRFWVEHGATKSRSPPFPGPLLGDLVETTYNVAHWGGKQAADTK